MGKNIRTLNMEVKTMTENQRALVKDIAKWKHLLPVLQDWIHQWKHDAELLERYLKLREGKK